jgi:hypothetical protein
MKLIQEQLLAGEALCWVGCEPRSRIWRKRLPWIVSFSLWTIAAGLLAGMLILMNPEFLKKSASGALPVLAPVCLAAAGGYLLGREIVRASQRAPQLYAITTRRALVISPGQDENVRSYELEAVKSAAVKRRKDGSGNIVFERGVHWNKDAQGRSTRLRREVGFFSLASVDEVRDRLCRLGQPELVRMIHQSTRQGENSYDP